MPQVKFVKEKKTVEARNGDNLREVALQNGIRIWGLMMGGDVVITKGDENCSKPNMLERIRIMTGPLLFWKQIGYSPNQLRLASCTQINGDIEVETNPPTNWHGEKFWN